MLTWVSTIQAFRSSTFGTTKAVVGDTVYEASLSKQKAEMCDYKITTQSLHHVVIIGRMDVR